MWNYIAINKEVNSSFGALCLPSPHNSFTIEKSLEEWRCKKSIIAHGVEVWNVSLSFFH